MKLVKAQCTNCGGTLEVDNTKDAAICPYCGTAYIVEQAINNYNFNLNFTVPDFEIVAGELVHYRGESATVHIPNSVTAIGAYAFADMAFLQNVVIPNSVTHIGDGAFKNCARLQKIDIPESVLTIGTSDAWRYWQTNYPQNEYYQKNLPPNGPTCYGSFEGCAALRSVILHNGLLLIGDRAFCGCVSLHDMEIPDTVETLGCGAFMDCTNLAEAPLSSHIKRIGVQTFKNCSAITKIVLPDTVEHIGDHAFASCTSLSYIRIPDSVGYCSAIFGYFGDSLPHLPHLKDSGIDASLEWKRKNYNALDCLKKYKPIDSFERIFNIILTVWLLFMGLMMFMAWIADSMRGG